jgi:sarcosine oxidase
MHTEIAVLGLGMIGAAALRALSEDHGAAVLGIGPAEPSDIRESQGPFASHYDHGRITRISDPDLIWATLAQRSITAYPMIAAHSGIAFHHPIGHLRLGSNDERLSAAEQYGRQLGAPIERLSGCRLDERFPEIQFPAGAEALIERGGAGWINPRAMVAAQLACATANGATILRDTVVAVQRQTTGYSITTRLGQTIQAQQVLISADAASVALLEPLLGQTLAMHTHAYTVVYAEVGPQQLAQYTATPTLIWPLPEHAFLSSIYTTSAARFPDGRNYLKIGGVPREPQLLATPDDWQTWYQGSGRPAEVAALREVLLTIYPQLDVQHWGQKTCANSYTAHQRPYVEQLAPGLVLCTGGCGAAAKSSDAIGRVGAQLLLNRRWNDSLPAAAFRAVWDGNG